ncbi:MAG: hypothetical protein WD081_03085 [Gammaproteobacteria bacterium]
MHRTLQRFVLVVALAGVSCTPGSEPRDVDAVARDYVALVLATGDHDPNFVDAYYGPEEIKTAAANDARTLVELREGALLLRGELAAIEPGDDAMDRLRHRYLDKQLAAAAARIGMLLGETLRFDEETQRLYDAVAPAPDVDAYERALATIERLVPGEGPLAARVEALRREFVIPPDRLQSVFDRAIAECRDRTLRHIDLPEGERFTLEFVTDKPWSGYNWYQGDTYSLIQVNTDLPIFIDRAVDLGCHEGYPGHHTYNVLLERELAIERGWVEFTVYALFSPQSLIAEGSANYGIDMAFPDDARYAFEEGVLMPLAHIPTENAARYRALREALAELDGAGNEAARRYLDGDWTRAQAIEWLVEYSLSSPERAAQRVDFFDTYRGYVINYNLGRDRVEAYIQAHGDSEAERWRAFKELLGSPRLPSDLNPP